MPYNTTGGFHRTVSRLSQQAQPRYFRLGKARIHRLFVRRIDLNTCSQNSSIQAEPAVTYPPPPPPSTFQCFLFTVSFPLVQSEVLPYRISKAG